MQTIHRILFSNAQNMMEIENHSVNLCLTSPPYPLVDIWNDLFVGFNSAIGEYLAKNDGFNAFELMHKELDKVWEEVNRTLKDGGIVCINIGDTTQKIGDDFRLYPSHSRIIQKFVSMGFSTLPLIIWRKYTNAPNKFMGSGMLPPGAYVTLEHEYILIFRKGGKREFKSQEEKQLRSSSTYLWEERNLWFSDIWDLRGVHQKLSNDKVRERSAAFPFELAYRLINMYSIKKDFVLDPFLGTGTTTLAAMASARNSIGIEIDNNFDEIIRSGIDEVIDCANEYHKERINNHLAFIKERIKTNGEPKHRNRFYDFPVVTKQGINFKLNQLLDVSEIEKNHFEVKYA